MATTDKAEWTLYDTDLTTKLAILPVMSSHLYLEHSEPGSGEIKIPINTTAAGLIENGMLVECNYRGVSAGSFFIDNIAKTYANAEENAGKILSVSGRGGMALLDDAIIYDGNTGETSREFSAVTKASILITLVTEAQTRGALAALTLDFDAVNDSASVAWTDSETYKLNVGTSLLDVMRQFAKTGIDFEMNYSAGGFVLSAYKNGTGTDKSETIYFRTGTNCEEVASDERGDEIKNVLYTKYKDGFVSVSDSTSITNRRRREKLLSLELAQTAASATTYASAELSTDKDPKKSISVKVFDGVNPRLFIDYDMGDYVTLDIEGTEYKYRVLGIQADFSGDQFCNVVVELNSLLYSNDLKMDQDLEWLKNQWNTARDANLLAVSYWAAIGAEGDTLDKANALHIIGTKLYVAAWFSNEIVGGVVCPTGIAIYDLSTGIWSTPSTAGSFLSDYPTCLTSIGTDLYVGYGSGEHVQKYDTVADTWSSLDGGLYYSVEPDQGTVNAIATDGTNIYVTGKFNEAGSPAVTVANIAKFTVATSTWSALGTGINNIGYSLLCSGSNVYAGGAFTSPSSYVAVWNGTTWAAMDSGLDGIVYSLVLYGTNILAGGAFTGKISEWNGSAWTVFGGGVDNTVYALAVYLTDVYVGGAFTDAGNRISRYSGGSWWLLGNGTGASTVFAICLYGDDVYVGGDFTEVGDAKPAIRLAVYFNNFESLTNYLENSSSNFNMGAAIHAAAASAITDTDEVPFWEATANALRKITWTNIKATLKTYFDTLYLSLTQTANRIIISNSSGVVTTDADLVYNADGSITIGQISTDVTTAANGIFQGANDVSVANFLQTYGVGVASYITGLRGRGTAASPTAVQAEDILFRLRGRGYDSAGNAGLTSAEIRWVANETHTTTAHGARLELYTTPNGSTTLTKVGTFGADGNLNIESGKTYNINGAPHDHPIYALLSGTLAQFAATTSAQLAGVLSDETGTGSAVFATSPTLVTPLLGTPTSGVMTNVTGLPLTTGVTGILSAANGGTGINNSTRTLTISANAGTISFTAAASTLTVPATGTAGLLGTAQTWSADNTFSGTVGIGVAPSATKKLSITYSVADPATTSYGSYVVSTVTNTVDGTQTNYAQYFQGGLAGTKNHSTIFGVGGVAINTHSAGTLVASFGGAFQSSNTGAGTVTSNYGVRINSAANSGGGTMTTNYGLFIQDQTAGSTNYALYTNAGLVRFGDRILPQQATTAGAPSYIKGAIYFDTTLNKLRVGGATAWETITSA